MLPRAAKAHTPLQLLAVPTAQAQSYSMIEEHVVVAIGVQLEPTHAIEVDDRRAMDPAKDGRVQLLIEIREAAPQKMGFSTHMQAGVIVGGFDPIDIGRLDERNPPGALDS